MTDIIMLKDLNPKKVMIMLVAGVIVLSISILLHQSLRLDEAQSLWQTSHSPARIIEIISEDVHVPLYHLILHYWQRIWGNSIIAARLLSLIFFVLAIPAIYMLGKFAYNKTIGLFATILVAVSPFLNWYGNEIRMYSLFMLLAVLNQYLFVRLYKHSDNRVASIPRHKSEDELPTNPKLLWIGYGATALLGIYTHYFFLTALLAQAVFLLIYRGSFTAKAKENFLRTGAFLFAAFIPWLYMVVKSRMLTEYIPSITKPTTVDVFNSFSQFLFGFHNDYINTLIVSLWPLAGLLGFLLLSKRTNITQETMYFLLVVAIPLSVIFFISAVFIPLYLARYFIFLVPSFYIFLGWMLSTYPKNLYKVIAVVLVGGMSLSLSYQMITPDNPVKEDYEAATNYLMENAGVNDVVVISPPFTIYPVEYYYKGHAQIETIPEWNRLITGPIPEFSLESLAEEEKTLTENHRNMWILLSYNQGYEEDIVLYFDHRYERIQEIEFSPGLRLYAYRLRYDDNYLRAALNEITNNQ